MYYRSIIPVVLLLLGSAASHAAFAGTVQVLSIHIAPAETVAGKHPEITGTIKADSAKTPGETTEVNVIASVTRPDHVVKTWTWKKIRIKAGGTGTFSIPKEYEVKYGGVYSVDFGVYSKDMRQLSKFTKSFTVVGPPLPVEKTPPQAVVKVGTGLVSGKTSTRPAGDQHFGVGVSANTVNTAVGATILFFPQKYKYVALQASYTMGMFTTAEARVLARFPRSTGINPYVGLGYASVTAKRTVDVIGIKTTFKDSGVSGVLGVEMPLSRKVFGYVELSGSTIDLEKEITSGGQTGIATVKYSPLTVGFSVVYFAF